MDVCLTFDVDMADYVGTGFFDEMETAFPVVQRCLSEFPEIRSTFFLRLDAQIEALHGDAEFVFEHHAAEIDWLRSHGHEVAWHHHSYRQQAGSWCQDTDPARNRDAVLRCGERAKVRGLRCARMGWGFHVPGTMQALDELGFPVDSSAIPRPRYAWETTVKDWSTTPQTPYHPSRTDCRVPGRDALRVLEVPITTVPLAAPGDGGPVLRYLNPAYRPEVFAAALERSPVETPVLISHPYESCERAASHPLLAFQPAALRRNLEALAERAAHFVTLSELAESWRGRSDR